MYPTDLMLLAGACFVLLSAVSAKLLYNFLFPADDLQIITDKELDYYAKTNKFCVAGSNESMVLSTKKGDS